MRRLQLWLQKDNCSRGYFLRDVVDMDDPYWKDRFNYRTFSARDKFETGIFYTNEEFKAEMRKAFEAAREDIEMSEHEDYYETNKYKDFEDYWSKR
jgi:hypothetical protein